MLYRLTRILMTAALRLFYRRVFTTGVESIPDKGPVILLANHQASLMDAAFLGVLLKRPIHYFTRGDIFKNKLAVEVMHALKMIPVFDHATKETVNDNEPSFTKAREILLAGGVILFFPEGNSHIERKLMPLKKGAFRLAFQTFTHSAYKQEILLIPVGINYAHPVLPETDVLIHLSTPLLISDYLQSYLIKPAGTILQLKKDTETALLKNVLHINKDTRQQVSAICLEINRNDDEFVTPHWMQATRKRFEEEQIICSVINMLDEEEFTLFSTQVKTYDNNLQEAKVKDAWVANLPAIHSYNAFMVRATFPLFIIAWLLNALPVLIAKRIADVKVMRPDFYSWIFVTISAFLYCIWIIVLFTGFALIDMKFAIAITLITMVLGPYTIFFLNHLQTQQEKKNFNKLKIENPKLFKTLKFQRQQIKLKLNSQ